MTVGLGKEPIIRREDAGREFLALPDLKPGDRVAVTFRTDKGQPRATVAVRRPVDSRGLVKTVDAQRRLFRISVDGDPRPEDVDMSIPPSAKLLLNGKGVDIGDISPDDRVEITHLASESPEAPRTIIALSALRSLRTTGFVAEVVRENDAAFLRLDRFGKIENLQFAEDCQVTIDGKSGADQQYGPSDLHPTTGWKWCTTCG